MEAKTKSPPHVVFAGGVTGGHLFPGLAVAAEIVARRPGARISFLGPGGALEREQVARAGYEQLSIACPRAPRGVSEAANFGYRMLQGYRAALGYLRRHKASVVIGLGSFASVPTALAAARLRVPLLLLEQNSLVGRANRRLARFASALCLSFDPALSVPAQRIIKDPRAIFVTGTPVRESFLRARRKRGTSPRIVILGGSGGARLLNQSVPAALAKLGSQLSAWQIVHQTGSADEAATAAAYRAVGLSAQVRRFLDEPAAVLADADLAICRAGGATLAELAVLHVPPVLVPFDAALDDHQRHNARAFAAAGAAVVLDDTTEPVMLSKHLALAVERLVASPARRATMQLSLSGLARRDAARQVSTLALGLAAGPRIVDANLPPELPASLASIDAIAA